MSYCKNCGVEVDEKLNSCPLCKYDMTKVHKENKKEKNGTQYQPQLSGHDKRILAWQVLSILAASAVILLVTVNLVNEQKIDWAIYPITGIAFSYVLISLPLLLYRNWLTLFIGIYASIGLGLFILDLIDEAHVWFIPLGLPIVTIILFVGVPLVAFSIKAKRKGANIIAFILLGLGVLSLGIDMLVKKYLNMTIKPDWSLIVLAAMIPITSILLFFHYKLSKTIDFKKIFHL